MPTQTPTSSNRSGGLGFLGALTIAFIVLKLIKKIAWSWWWVLMPLWALPAAVAAVLIAIGFFYSLAKVIIYIFERRAYNKEKRARAIRLEERKRAEEVLAARAAKQAASDARNNPEQ